MYKEDTLLSENTPFVTAQKHAAREFQQKFQTGDIDYFFINLKDI